MDKTILVMFPLEEGRRLVKTLEATDLDIKAALWLYEEERDEWTLAIASPRVDTEGSRYVYNRIQQILRNQTDFVRLSLMDITALSPNDRRMKPLIEGLHIEEEAEETFLRKASIRGKKSSVYLDEAYLYLVRP